MDLDKHFDPSVSDSEDVDKHSSATPSIPRANSRTGDGSVSLDMANPGELHKTENPCDS